MKESPLSDKKTKKMVRKDSGKGQQKGKKVYWRPQQQPPKSLLQRTRSLQVLFGQLSPREKGEEDAQQSGNKFQLRNQVTDNISGKHDEGNPWKERRKYTQSNQYMVFSKLKNEAETKTIKSPKYSNRNSLLKGQLKIKWEQPQAKVSSKLKESLYNPDNYNWRKSLSRDRQELRSIVSPRLIAPLRLSHQEYFPSKNTSNNNETRETKEQRGKEYPNSKIAKSKSMSNSSNRRNRPLSKPKVIKLNFKPLEREEKIKSSKSLMFTFGL